MKNQNLLTEKEAQKLYGYSLAWWRCGRWNGSGPKYVKLKNGTIRYKWKDLESYFKSKASKSFLSPQKEATFLKEILVDLKKIVQKIERGKKNVKS